MEFLIFIALVTIIILLLAIKSRQKQIESRTHQSFLSLKKELFEIKEAAKKIPATGEPINPPDETIIQWRPQVPGGIVKPATKPEPEEITHVKKKEPIISAAVPSVEEHVALPPKPVQRQERPVPVESWWDKWLRNNPDLEKFIGENLINKIGITVLVLGIAFFVKYAIDQNWIKEAGRVSIGIGCGVVLTGLAHYLRNTYRAFSSVLAGGGIAVFYFTIAFAFHQYHLFSQTAAFVIMVFITIFAVILSLLYDKLELAVIAATGGFITPFLASTGNGDYRILFTYLLILNLGMLALAYFKKWNAINVIALLFTLCIYGGWLLKSTISGNGFQMYQSSLMFATSFYILFLGMSLIYNIRTELPFKAFDFSLLMLTTFSYYAAGMTNLHYWNDGAWQGLFTISLGAVNFCLAAYFYKTNTGDKNLLYLLIGLTLTFVSLSAPVQLHGHTITLFWSAEFVLLYWLFQRTSISVFKYSSFVIMILMLISMLMDWEIVNDFSGNHLVIIYKNLQGFITNIVAVAAFTFCGVLLRKDHDAPTWIAGIRNSVASTAMIMTGAIILYLTCVFGANLYFYSYQDLDVPNTWHQLITYLFTVLLLWVIRKYRLEIKPVWRLVLVAGCAALYFFSISFVINLRNGVLQNRYPAVQLWVHWLAALILLFLIYQAVLVYRQNRATFIKAAGVFAWFANIVLIAFFSVECMNGYVILTASMQNIHVALQQYFKAGLTIVWALCSFAIMWLGMSYKYKTLRIISLFLFSVALAKLFLFDIRNISEGGKIAAFIMLGILLLIISFMYQKLKKIIIDDTSR